MNKTILFCMVMAALLAGCGKQDGILRIEEQGSFAVGGTVLTDSLGRTFHGDHATCSIRSLSMHDGIRSCSLTAWVSFPRRGRRRPTDAKDFRTSFCDVAFRLTL